MITFKKGEVKNVTIRVRDRDNLDFKISKASYEISGGGIKPTSKSAAIGGHRIWCRLDSKVDAFKAGGKYTVKFTFVVGPETYIAFVHVEIK